MIAAVLDYSQRYQHELMFMYLIIYLLILILSSLQLANNLWGDTLPL